MSKPKVIKDYEKLDESIQQQIKLKYPYGFHRHLISFNNAQGLKVSALPFETEEKYYLVRMSVAEARQIIEEDEDYDEDGLLKSDIKEAYLDKHEMEELQSEVDEESEMEKEKAFNDEGIN